jgi:hypothetical protein
MQHTTRGARHTARAHAAHDTGRAPHGRTQHTTAQSRSTPPSAPRAHTHLCLCGEQLRLGGERRVVQRVLLGLQAPEALLSLLQAVLLRGTQLLQLAQLRARGVRRGGVCAGRGVCVRAPLAQRDARGPQACRPSTMCVLVRQCSAASHVCLQTHTHACTRRAHLLLLRLLRAVAVLQRRLDLRMQLLEPQPLCLDGRRV